MSGGYHVNYTLAVLPSASETLAFSTNKGGSFAQLACCGDYATMNGRWYMSYTTTRDCVKFYLSDYIR